MASIYSATFTESNGLFAPSRADSDTPRSNTHKYTHPHTLVHVLQVALKSANEIARRPINSSIELKMTSVEWAKEPESRHQLQLSRPLYAFTHSPLHADSLVAHPGANRKPRYYMWELEYACRYVLGGASKCSLLLPYARQIDVKSVSR